MRNALASLLAAAAALAGAPRSLADSWAPFPNQRIADPTGRHYVALERDGIAADLAAWLERECLPIDGIVSYFCEVKYAPVVDLLIARMERPACSGREGAALAKALRSQTGAVIPGADPKAWREWIEKRRWRVDARPPFLPHVPPGGRVS